MANTKDFLGNIIKSDKVITKFDNIEFEQVIGARQLVIRSRRGGILVLNAG